MAALVLLAATAAAQEEDLLPWPIAGTPDVILPAAPPAAEPTAAQEPPPEPSPAETIDEAAEALVHLLTADTPEGPPMAECAVNLLRTRLATAVEGDDVLTAIALENELLSLCNRRQQLVLEVLATELLLASVVAGDVTAQAAMPAAVVVPEVPPETPAATLDQLDATTALTEPEPAPAAALAEPPPPTSPGLSWVTVLGSAGNLRAAVTDGTAVWWVREGDTLTGGWQVTRIAARPPGVTLSHAEAGHHALPFHSGPAAGAGGEP